MTGEYNYKYLSQEAPVAKINYSYSAFLGNTFLEAWEKSRKEVLAQLSTDQNAAKTTSELPSAGLFQEWLLQLNSNTFKQWESLELLLKRFEVTKRIYDEYDENFRCEDKSRCNSIFLYVRFAELLLLVYQNTKRLPFLNALIKVNDILCSRWVDIDQSEHVFLKQVLQGEIEVVRSLEAKLKTK